MMGPGARLALLVVILAAASCSSTEETLDPAQLSPPPTSTAAAAPAAGDAGAGTSPAQATAAPAQPAQAATGQSAAVGATPARVRIDPIVGAPAAATGAVSTRLTTRAPDSGFAVVPIGDASSTHVLKGYFSASPEGSETTIFYVWDVIDAAGNRVHRFSGQEKVAGGQGWPSVTEASLQAIADRTAVDLGSWIAGRQG